MHERDKILILSDASGMNDQQPRDLGNILDELVEFVVAEREVFLKQPGHFATSGQRTDLALEDCNGETP